MKVTLKHNDCMNVLPTMPDNSVDFTLTDIPYNEVNRGDNGLRTLYCNSLRNAVKRRQNRERGQRLYTMPIKCGVEATVTLPVRRKNSTQGLNSIPNGSDIVVCATATLTTRESY